MLFKYFFDDLKIDLLLHSCYLRFISVFTRPILILSNSELLRWPMIGTFTLSVISFTVICKRRDDHTLLAMYHPVDIDSRGTFPLNFKIL